MKVNALSIFGLISTSFVAGLTVVGVGQGTYHPISAVVIFGLVISLVLFIWLFNEDL